MFKQHLTVEQAFQKGKHFCSYQERCHTEVKEKLYGFGLNKQAVEMLLSRLIEEDYLNEERYAQQFAGSGQIGFYAGCNPSKAIEVVEIIREVLADVAENGMSHEEVERAKGAVRGSLVLSQEDSGSRMSRIGKNEIVYGQVMGFDEILKAISRVNPTDVREIASEFLTKSPTLALVGPFKSEAKFEKVLKS